MQETPYEDEHLEFNKALIVDDSKEAIREYLMSCRVTNAVRTKLLSIYDVWASIDGVLTNRSDLQIDHRIKCLRLDLTEYKMSLKGIDTISLLYPDFEMACQLIIRRAEDRLSRSYNGLERLCMISTYTTQKEIKKVALDAENRFGEFFDE